MNERPADVLAVDALTVRYGGLVAIHDVSLTVRADEVCGLIGPNGAGKSSLIDAVTGFVPSSSGDARLAGESIAGDRPHRIASRGLARTFQSLQLFDDLSVRENLVVAVTTPRWWSPMRDAIRPTRPSAEERGAIDAAATLTGIDHLLDAVPSELSNGERHRAALARALVGAPKLLLLDEPAAGLDPDETEQLATLLRSLPGAGTAVLLVDHDMALVMAVCDRIHVLDRGSLVATGTPAEIREDGIVVAAYLGDTPPGGGTDGAATDSATDSGSGSGGVGA